MPDGGHRCTEDTLRDLAEVVSAPAGAMPERLSGLLASFVPHEAVLLLSADANGGHRSGAGDADFVDGVSFLDLDELRRTLPLRTTRLAEVNVAGTPERTLQVMSGNGALLLLARPVMEPARAESVAQVWNVIALRVQEIADAASPGFLQLARESSGERMDALVELVDKYSTTLESVLAALRSSSLGDRAARLTATGIAAEGLTHLRAAGNRARTVTEEPVAGAFRRLRDEITALTRHRDIEVQFVDPPADGRPLPSEVAHGARAVVRGSILALVDRSDAARVRVQWDCDGTSLLIELRDDGRGDAGSSTTTLPLVHRRVQALGGRISVRATLGWGTEVSIAIPLDPPHPSLTGIPRMSALRRREIDVLQRLATGIRNRDIAAELSISENTVKFHIASIYRKLGVHSRAEATAFYLSMVGSAGVLASPS